MSAATFTLGARLVILLALTAYQVAGLAPVVQTADNSIQSINRYNLSAGQRFIRWKKLGLFQTSCNAVLNLNQFDLVTRQWSQTSNLIQLRQILKYRNA